MIIASIDIGTNTVLLLIARVNKVFQIETILNEFRIPRIGKGLLPGQPIKDEKINELFKVLKDYSSLILLNQCDDVIVTATHPLRIASNSDEIIGRILKEFNWKVNLILGDEEAKFAFLGAISNRNSNKRYLVIDIGGGSTEIIIGIDSEISYKKSFDIGVVNGTENFLFTSPPSKANMTKFHSYLEKIFHELRDIVYAPVSAIALAGTPTTLSCMKQNLDKYSEEIVEGSILSNNDVKHIIDIIYKLTENKLEQRYKSILVGRQDIILAGAIILLKLMELLNLTEVIVSTKGIRYGAISNYLQKRARDEN